MAQTYDLGGRQVYDDKGKQFDARTGQEIGNAPANTPASNQGVSPAAPSPVPSAPQVQPDSSISDPNNPLNVLPKGDPFRMYYYFSLMNQRKNVVNDLVEQKQLLVKHLYDSPLNADELAKLNPALREEIGMGNRSAIEMQVRLINDDIAGRKNTFDQSLAFLEKGYEAEQTRIEQQHSDARAVIYKMAETNPALFQNATEPQKAQYRAMGIPEDFFSLPLATTGKWSLEKYATKDEFGQSVEHFFWKDDKGNSKPFVMGQNPNETTKSPLSPVSSPAAPNTPVPQPLPTDVSDNIKKLSREEKAFLGDALTSIDGTPYIDLGKFKGSDATVADRIARKLGIEILDKEKMLSQYQNELKKGKKKGETNEQFATRLAEGFPQFNKQDIVDEVNKEYSDESKGLWEKIKDFLPQ